MNIDVKKFNLKILLIYFLILSSLQFIYFYFETNQLIIDWVVIFGCLLVSLRTSYTDATSNNANVFNIQTFWCYFFISTLIALAYSFYMTGRFYIDWGIMLIFIVISLGLSYTGKPLNKSKK